MIAQRIEHNKVCSNAVVLISLLAGLAVAHAQTPEMQGLPPGQFGSSPPGLVAGLDPATTALPSGATALPDKVAATSRIVPLAGKPAARPQTAPPGPWMTALLALAGLVGVGLAVVVLTLAVREMRREAVQRRRFRRRRVSRRPDNAPELDPRWLPRQRGMFDN
jgi:hypothetical protein